MSPQLVRPKHVCYCCVQALLGLLKAASNNTLIGTVQAFISSADAEYASTEDDCEDSSLPRNINANRLKNASGLVTQPSSGGYMSVEAAPFLPGGSAVQATSSVADEAVIRRKARERALKILAGGSPSKEFSNTDSSTAVADKATGACNGEGTWLTVEGADTEGPGGDSNEDVGSGGRRAGEQELRIDPADGLLYCKADFLLECVCGMR